MKIVNCNSITRKSFRTSKGRKVEAKRCEGRVFIADGIDPRFEVGICGKCGILKVEKKND